ncbi:ribonuclease HI family protein [Candidatus Uhrbacteria bacterium]|nr:ribonuclease HI family protein [Candidatus Uhrbacteria bacterium]
MDEKLFVEGPITIYTDGASRGNPGAAAVGYVIGDKKYGQTIGHTTNNVAEYTAIVFALKKAKVLLGKPKAKSTDLTIRMDSELAFKQLIGKYRLREPELQTLFIEIWNSKQDFRSVTFEHVRREFNKDADMMANLALDGKL